MQDIGNPTCSKQPADLVEGLLGIDRI